MEAPTDTPGGLEHVRCVLRGYVSSRFQACVLFIRDAENLLVDVLVVLSEGCGRQGEFNRCFFELPDWSNELTGARTFNGLFAEEVTGQELDRKSVV